MTRTRRFPWMAMAAALVVKVFGEANLDLPLGQAGTCTISPNHGGLLFPVEKIESHWACRLQEIIGDHTIANSLGPLRAALSESMYRFLLDRPPLAAGLINRLGLGGYKSESKGQDRFWADDGEGTQGIVELVYRDPASRIYYLEGSHDSGLFPDLSGKAVVFLRMIPVRDSGGIQSMDSIVVVYVKLDNRFLSGLASLLRPLVRTMVSGKLMKGVNTVNRLGLVMRQYPERVLSVATNSPGFADQDVSGLKATLTEARSFGKPDEGKASPP